MRKITYDLARDFLDYNPETGLFKWKESVPSMFESGPTRTPEQKCRIFNARYAGRDAFTATHVKGHKHGHFLGWQVAAHRMAWLLSYKTMPNVIDHINGDPADNRLSNLRNVNKRENALNMAISKRNRSGIIGVRFNPSRGRWDADIRVNRKLIFLGRFRTLLDAASARRSAEALYGFHENHGKR